MARKVKVTRKQVDAAAAEVRAFKIAGLQPDPTVVRIADAGSMRKQHMVTRTAMIDRVS